MSWHYLECYFSQMVVTDAYLDQLSDSKDLSKHEPPHIRCSEKLRLKDAAQRVQIRRISAHIIISMLADYKTPVKLGIVKHLIS